MRRSFPACPVLPLALLLFGLAFCARPAVAQRGPAPLTHAQFGVGWVGNAPDAVLGGTAYVIVPALGGIGLYVDAKFDASDPTDDRAYDATVTSLEVAPLESAHYNQTEGSWKSFNVAVIRPINPSFWVYAGGGVVKLTRYDLYDLDPDLEIGLGGLVWAENPETAETRANMMVGIMMRLSSRLTAQFGYETQPNGVTAGFALRLPAW
ncbi:MAG TPA: hypothetical protein VLA36_00020 [Longimicrobiales bacterium]|nr:hypothetical protein [Longimicrobiales bacterium]